MVNKVLLIGNLGQDPQVRSTASGTPVTNFSLATSRRWKGADGKRQEQTEWHQVVCFGRLAEIAGQYLARGRQVYIEGRLQTQSWQDRETGKPRYRTEIVAESLQMLGGGAQPAAEGEAPEGVEAEAVEVEAVETEEAPKPVAKKKPAAKKPRRRTAKKKA